MRNKDQTFTQDSFSRGVEAELLRLPRAAELLRCTVEELLNLGANGTVGVIAPILAGGRYTWPRADASLAFPEVDHPFTKEFGVGDRVWLTKYDLACIEAQGWATPNTFYAPHIAREPLNNSLSRAKVDQIAGWVSQHVE
ncbi:hypothetical protein, partial [Massilia orientalis]